MPDRHSDVEIPAFCLINKQSAVLWYSNDGKEDTLKVAREPNVNRDLLSQHEWNKAFTEDGSLYDSMLGDDCALIFPNYPTPTQLINDNRYMSSLRRVLKMHVPSVVMYAPES